MENQTLIGQHYYTWCERDEGCDKISGFQTRAKSPSITPALEETIKIFCTRYDLPRSLTDLEMRSGDLTPEDLQTAPIAIHYFEASPTLRGLTRIRMAARQRGGGNFFAHTLVFPGSMLQSVHYNPFQLVRSGVFQDDAGATGQQLEDLSTFPRPVSGFPLYKNIDWGPDSFQAIRKLLEALTDPENVNQEKMRPIILCTPQFQELAPLMETALLLLPPEFRATVTFSTYDIDPYRLRSATAAKDNLGQRLIGTIAEREGGKFLFRDDEYQSRFFAFNLTESRFSEPATVCPNYCRLADAAMQSADYQDLHLGHRLFGLLEIGATPARWDKALPARLLMDSNDPTPEVWQEAALALKTTCLRPDEARTGFQILCDRSGKFLKAMDELTFKTVVEAIVSLGGLAAAKTPVFQTGNDQDKKLGKNPLLLNLVIALLSIAGTWAYLQFTGQPKVGEPLGLVTQHEAAMADLRSQLAQSQQQVEAQRFALTELEKKISLSGSVTDPQKLTRLEQAISGDRLQKQVKDNALVINFDVGLFNRGEVLTAEGKKLLENFKKQLLVLKDQNPLLVEVEGRTDNVPVPNKRLYGDNNVLGYVRALTVVNFFRQNSNLSPDIFKITSVGEQNPLFPNDLPEQRLKNRTVVLKLIPRS